jgi:hypothetical protein
MVVRLPWWWLKDVVFILNLQLAIFLESLPHYKKYRIKRNTDRKQRRIYRCHTRYKKNTPITLPTSMPNTNS